MVANFVVLFLIAAGALPDEPDSSRDLRLYYASNRRYFWSLISLFQVRYLARGLSFVKGILSQIPQGKLPLVVAILVTNMLVQLATALVLLATRSCTVHYFGTGPCSP